MSTSSPLLADDNFRQGLALDISILRTLAARHRCNHGRTLYFRRIAMVLKSLEKKYDVMDALSRLQALQREVNKLHQEEQRKKHRRSRHGRESEYSPATSTLPWTREEEWMLSHTFTPGTAKGCCTSSSNPATPILEEMRQLIELWTAGIPEILSRIHHASRALFLEVSRGFFLPFCSVALGALARIRSMLMTVGRLGLTQLVHGIQADVMMTMATSSDRHPETMLTEGAYSKAMETFLDEGNNKQGFSVKSPIAMSGSGKPTDKQNSEMLLTTLGLTRSKNATGSNLTATAVGFEGNDSETRQTQAVENGCEHNATSVFVSYLMEKDSALKVEPGVVKQSSFEPDMDVGESIGFAMDMNKHNVRDTEDTTKRKGRTTFGLGLMKQNTTFESKKKQMMPLQKKKGKSETMQKNAAQVKEESKKRKSKSTPPASTVRSTKERGKVKKQKGNFFDDLFG